MVKRTLITCIVLLTLAGCGPAATPVPTSTPVPPTPTATLPPLTGSGGGRIVFSSRRGPGDYAIYVMNADGTDKRRLTHNPLQDEEAAWSPDGTQIAFNIDNYAGRTNIHVMNADGSNLRQLTTKGNASGAAWSPDGTRIAFTRYDRDGSADLYVMNADGTGEQPLTATDKVRVYSPAWSPDGTHIVCVYDSSTELLAEESTICVLDVQQAQQSGGAGVDDLRPLPRPGKDINDRPDWSPTGSRIVFSAAVENRRHIFVVNVDGTDLRRLTQTTEVDAWAPTWSPDGTQIVYQANPDAHWDIFVMNVEDALQGADGTGQRRLTTDVANDTTPHWVP